MIDFVFTLDYEIYGNGEGSLQELVLEPAERLMSIFKKRKAEFVIFAEVAELQVIEAAGTDETIHQVKRQLREFCQKGTELGLHIHPQWYKARHNNGKWMLNYDEYNLCNLNRERMVQIIGHSIEYLRELLSVADFTPFSFRAGNWLFQPSQNLSNTLAAHGIKVDSSVFKGGIQHQNRLDYRRAIKNGDYWRFSNDVCIPDPQGILVELPIYARMVPAWQMLTTKRMQIQRKSPKTPQNVKERLLRILDYARYCHPIKFDYCRMTMNEMTHLLDAEIQKDLKDPTTYRPMIAIGHTKDLLDYGTIDHFLDYLLRKEIKISGFREVYHKIQVLDKNVNKKNEH